MVLSLKFSFKLSVLRVKPHLNFVNGILLPMRLSLCSKIPIQLNNLLETFPPTQSTYLTPTRVTTFEIIPISQIKMIISM